MTHPTPPTTREAVAVVRYGQRVYIHAAGRDGLPVGRLLAILEPGAAGLVLRTRTATTKVRGEEDALRLLALPGWGDAS